jgi:hypothetical protein
VRRRGTFDGDRLDLLRFSQHFRLSESKESVEGMQGGKPLIACAHTISPRSFHGVEEVAHSMRRQVSKQ